MELDLSRGHIVLDGDPAPHEKGHSSPVVYVGLKSYHQHPQKAPRPHRAYQAPQNGVY